MGFNLSRWVLAAGLACAALCGASCAGRANTIGPAGAVDPPSSTDLPVSVSAGAAAAGAPAAGAPAAGAPAAGAPAVAKPAPPPVHLRGQFTPGGAVFGQAPPGAKVSVNGRPVRVGSTGEFVFGFGRDDTDPVTLEVEWPEGRWSEQVELLPREFDVQRVEGVAEKHVNPPAEVTDRIRRENAKVGAARASDSSMLAWAQPFVWPLRGPITGVYGSQRVYNGAPRSPHYGLDIAAPTGAVVVAPAAGVVSLAEPDLYFSGGTLILDHGHGIYSTFIHLSALLVEAGQQVEQGEPVAKVGATGRATGPHLDWRINWFNTRLDPALWMRDVPMPARTEEAR